MLLANFVYLCVRRKRLCFCTMRTRWSRVTTSWTSGFCPSPIPLSSSSRLRWMVRYSRTVREVLCVSLSRSITKITWLNKGASCCSVPSLHCGAPPGQVCGHAHQLVCQDQPTPSEGQNTPHNSGLFGASTLLFFSLFWSDRTCPCVNFAGREWHWGLSVGAGNPLQCSLLHVQAHGESRWLCKRDPACPSFVHARVRPAARKERASGEISRGELLCMPGPKK